MGTAFEVQSGIVATDSEAHAMALTKIGVCPQFTRIVFIPMYRLCRVYRCDGKSHVGTIAGCKRVPIAVLATYLRRYLLKALFFIVCISFQPACGAQVFRNSDLELLLHTGLLLRAGDQGQGIRIGVISDGAVNYKDVVRRGALPANVTMFGISANQGDEGDWMLQVIHQVAPKSRLSFCPAGSGRGVVECARELVKQFHADIVVDDVNPQPVFYFPTLKARGLAQLSRAYRNVLFFTGAGNNGGGYYEAPWTPARLILDGVDYYAQDFGRSLGDDSDLFDEFRLGPGRKARIVLGTDATPSRGTARCLATNPILTVALLDASGRILRKTISRCPVTHLQYYNAGFTAQRLRIAILLPPDSFPTNPSLKLVAIVGDPGVSPLMLRYHTRGGAGNSALGGNIAAVGAVDPNSGLADSYISETLANSGPQCIDYRLTQSNGWLRLSRPQCIKQPRFVAPDRTMVLMKDRGHYRYRPFIGDSAAGPAAAGVAALLLSAHVDPNRMVKILEHSAIAQAPASGWDPQYGYGLIDADAAAVSAGVLPPFKGAAHRLAANRTPALFHPSPAFKEFHRLQALARQGSQRALATLKKAALRGQPDAQTWLALYAHGRDDNTVAARWAKAAAKRGQPVAQSLLGSLYNRGWGVAIDPRAAQAWWYRAARAGIANAMYNMGLLMAGGRGTAVNRVLGYALMRAAVLRGMRDWPAVFRLRSSLSRMQVQTADNMAAHFAADPRLVPAP